MMNSVDLYMMICRPLKYDDFRETRNVVKMIAIGSGVCILINCEHVALILLDTLYSSNVANVILERFHLTEKIILGIHIFSAVKIIITKGIYSIAVIKISLMTRNGLRQSAKMSNNNKNKENAHRRLFIFSLIPLFLSILFTANEVLFVVKSILRTDNLCYPHWIFRHDVTFGISASFFTFGSLVYFGGYLILFPQIRQTVITCCTSSGSGS